MKHILLFSFLFVSRHLFCQSYYMKAETRNEGGMSGMVGAMVKKMKTTVIVYSKNNRMKVESETYGMTQTTLFEAEAEKVEITTLGSGDCVRGVFTKDELKADSLENDIFITDVQVEKTKETKRILGHPCKKTIIRYSSANSDNKMIKIENEMSVWIAQDIPYAGTSDPALEVTKRNALYPALKSLGGFSMLTEVTANGLTSIIEVTEFNTKEIKDSEFEIKTKSCGDPLNLKEYKKLLLKRKREAERNDAHR